MLVQAADFFSRAEQGKEENQIKQILVNIQLVNTKKMICCVHGVGTAG